MILSPRRATWARWRRLATTQYSILRGLEYERMAGLVLKGCTLDVGGGARSSYAPLFQVDGILSSVNIDAPIQPTILADLNQPLPMASGSYDNAISLNTLEHIQNDGLVIAEMMRVLKPGGRLHLIVPFLYRVHASPSDFHRHTAFWWLDFLCARGMTAENLSIEPLLWDPLTSAFSLVEFQFGRLRGLVKKMVMLVAVLRHGSSSREERLPAALGHAYAEFALGYYIHGVKT